METLGQLQWPITHWHVLFLSRDSRKIEKKKKFLRERAFWRKRERERKGKTFTLLVRAFNVSAGLFGVKIVRVKNDAQRKRFSPEQKREKEEDPLWQRQNIFLYMYTCSLLRSFFFFLLSGSLLFVYRIHKKKKKNLLVFFFFFFFLGNTVLPPPCSTKESRFYLS